MSTVSGLPPPVPRSVRQANAGGAAGRPGTCHVRKLRRESYAMRCSTVDGCRSINQTTPARPAAVNEDPAAAAERSMVRAYLKRATENFKGTSPYAWDATSSVKQTRFFDVGRFTLSYRDMTKVEDASFKLTESAILATAVFFLGSQS